MHPNHSYPLGALVCGDGPTAGLAHGAMRLCAGPRQRTRIPVSVVFTFIAGPRPWARGGAERSRISFWRWLHR
eukprot:2238589-Prymnesium_polylepis.1